MRKRVVITGMGAVTPIGIGLQEYWEGLLAGRSGVGPITFFDTSDFPVHIAAEVKDFNDGIFFERKQAKQLSRAAQLGIASTIMCLEDSAWKKAGDERMGIAAGVSNSSQEVLEEIGFNLTDRGYKSIHPFYLTKAFPHSTATEAGLITGFQSQIMTFATACTAGINAIGYAAEEIRTGRCTAFLCPATDATITPCSLACFCKANMLSKRNDSPQQASRPFDAKRDGGVLGEGAGCVMLEELDHAKRRGAKIYCEVLGFSTSGCGYNCDPNVSVPRGMTAALLGAMMQANVAPQSINYVGVHGVSDVHLDKWETQALKAVFNEHAYHIPMSSVKSMIGIPQNAAGVLQLIATVLSIRDGIIPATINYEYPDPECDLDYVPNVARRNRINRAVVISHGFNGSDAAVLIGKHKD